MGPPSPMRRPPLQHEESASSSLNGMEKVISRGSIPFDIFEDLIEKYLDKPLPPTPRKPSSVYSTHKEEIIDSYRERRHRSEIESTEIFLKPTTYSAGISKISNMKPERPQLAQQAHAESDSIVERWHTRQRAQRTTEVGTGSASKLHRSHSSHADNSVDGSPTNKPRVSSRKAEALANDYRDALRGRSPAPPVIEAIPYYPENDYFPSPISATITDVVDHSLIPHPLRVSSLESERPSSHFSMTSSDSDPDRIHLRVRDSLKAYARKAFRLPKASAEEIERERIISIAEAKYPLMSPPSSRRPSRLESIASQRRASIQQGLSHMYDTITSFSIGSSKPKSGTETSSSQIWRELRSPAIPTTAYQQLGPKAWEAPKSPRIKSPSKRHNPFRSGSQESATANRQSSPAPTQNSKARPPPSPRSPRLVASKIAAALHGGTAQVGSLLRIETPAQQEAKLEQRREQLKKKIVMIGAADQYPDGQLENVYES
ncbi:MAG: hypothetical protein FRX48_00304 [Lasallia pustulata]|uniref:Uncharacterized protein n=1 Tax=Lasallia pustulata TaxID=136370 RepID=A0A5M8Q0I6_9LECA|nr:MAG: hypothetical protein FRX48_00304 [Lasallia pustulata]